MEPIRKPYQGVWNVIRFNRDKYFQAFFVMCMFFWLSWREALNPNFTAAVITFLFLMISVPLLLTWLVYDRSGLYSFHWLKEEKLSQGERMVTVHAGFDESSEYLARIFPENELIVYDIYDPQKHTESSIKRARKAYPAYPGSIAVRDGKLPLQKETVALVILFLAAHEIRDRVERIEFFREIHRVLKPGGRVIITEHLYDLPNFLTYTAGVSHFLTWGEWEQAFEESKLGVLKKYRINRLIHNFILQKNGTAS